MSQDSGPSRTACHQVKELDLPNVYSDTVIPGRAASCPWEQLDLDMAKHAKEVLCFVQV